MGFSSEIIDFTYVAPAMNISIDFALMMIDTIPINKLAAIATTAIRAVMLFWALQRTIGIKRSMTKRRAMRNLVARLRAEPEEMYTFGSLEMLWNGSWGSSCKQRSKILTVQVLFWVFSPPGSPSTSG